MKTIVHKTFYDQAGEEGRYFKIHPVWPSAAEVFQFFQPVGLVLEVGAGSGHHARFMRDRGLHVVGLDISMVGLRRTQVAKRVCARAESLPFKDGAFDSVLCSELLEHLPAPRQCMAEVHRVLKPGGIACFTTPCFNLPLRPLVPALRKLLGAGLRPGEHLHLFSTEGLTRLLGEFFEIVDVKHKNFTAFLKYRFNTGYRLDDMLSNVARRWRPLACFAGTNYIKVVKRPR